MKYIFAIYKQTTTATTHCIFKSATTNKKEIETMYQKLNGKCAKKGHRFNKERNREKSIILVCNTRYDRWELWCHCRTTVLNWRIISL